MNPDHSKRQPPFLSLFTMPNCLVMPHKIKDQRSISLTTEQQSYGDRLLVDVSDEGERGQEQMTGFGRQSEHGDVAVDHFHLRKLNSVSD